VDSFVFSNKVHKKWLICTGEKQEIMRERERKKKKHNLCTFIMWLFMDLTSINKDECA